MPDFSKAKIYRVYCGEEQYIGSTIRPLSERMNEHRQDYKRRKSCSSAVLFDKYGVENCKIELIEDCPCERREILLKREGEIQRQMGCVNANVAGRTQKEYHKQWRTGNQEYAEKMRQYELKNKEHLDEKRRQWYDDNKEKVAERKRQYWLENKEHLDEKRREYCLKNKEKIAAYKKQYRLEKKTN